MKNFLSLLMIISLFTIFSPNGVYAQDAHAPNDAPDAAAMQKIMELGSPSEKHKILENLVGSWDYKISFWMSSQAPAQESIGTSENKLIFDGRFLETTSHSVMKMDNKDIPFEGRGLVGFDNIKQEFNSIWIDSMSTGMAISKGTYDETTKTIKESGEMSCPMKGAQISFRSELKFIDADNYSYSQFTLDETGKEFKAMEIAFVRKK